MPELPDVEAQRRFAQHRAVGATIGSVACREPAVLRNTTPQGLGRALGTAAILSAVRRGKWLWLVTDAAADVLVHFGMTGSFHWHAEDDRMCDDDLVHFRLTDGTFAYNASRKLGGIWLVRAEQERHDITGRLGVDGLDADAGVLRSTLSGSRAGIKAALMDQSRIAGIGNLLADELCWQARVHPATACASLPDACWSDLADRLADLLDVAVKVGRVPTDGGYLTSVRDDEDARCPRCRQPLASATVAGRSTRWCPAEQEDPG